jgi:hypothetical protein
MLAECIQMESEGLLSRLSRQGRDSLDIYSHVQRDSFISLQVIILTKLAVTSISVERYTTQTRCTLHREISTSFEAGK